MASDNIAHLISPILVDIFEVSSRRASAGLGWHGGKGLAPSSAVQSPNNSDFPWAAAPPRLVSASGPELGGRVRVQRREEIVVKGEDAAVGMVLKGTTVCPIASAIFVMCARVDSLSVGHHNLPIGAPGPG